MKWKFLDPVQREAEPMKGAVGESWFTVKGIDQATRTVTALVSTPNVDRYEEIVEPSAFKSWLPTFMANPVLCAGHQYIGHSGEPTTIGHWTDLQITKEGLIGTCKFMEDDELADKWWKRFQQKVNRAFSVGWITHNWEMREFELAKGVKKRIRVFTEVELIEISAVAIPANRESLMRAASAGGVSGTPDIDLDQLVEKLVVKLEPSLAEAIKKQLNTDPGGQLCSLIQDVVMSMQGQGDQGFDDGDVPDTGAPTGKGSTQNSELKAALASVVQTIKV